MPFDLARVPFCSFCTISLHVYCALRTKSWWAGWNSAVWWLSKRTTAAKKQGTKRREEEMKSPPRAIFFVRGSWRILKVRWKILSGSIALATLDLIGPPPLRMGGTWTGKLEKHALKSNARVTTRILCVVEHSIFGLLSGRPRKSGHQGERAEECNAGWVARSASKRHLVRTRSLRA